MRYDLENVNRTDYIEALAKVEQGDDQELYEDLVKKIAGMLNIKPQKVQQDLMFARLHGKRFQNLYDEAIENDLKLLEMGGESKHWFPKKRKKKSTKAKSKRTSKKCKCK